jgi:rhomboid protease GluP
MFFSGINIFSIKTRELLEWGANRRYDTIGENEWWRLFTNIFLHNGIIHLVMNISGLAIAAFLIEPILGRKKYFALYVLSGLCASISSILWYPNAISVGASGAIFGLYGSIFALLLLKKFNSTDKDFLLTFTAIYVIINLLWGLIGGIDNAAHIGGLISGFLVTLLLYELEEDNVI